MVMKEKKKKNVCGEQGDIVHQILQQKPSKQDPLGMYTGKPIDPDEVPVQDADDL